jgi:hypothetical protein
MSSRVLRHLCRWVVPLAVLVAVPYGILVTGTSSPEFKAFAEDKVSEFLKADVKIGKIRVGLLNRIILSHFEIQPDLSAKSPYRLEVERIVFRYSVSQLLQRNFKIPSAVLLKSPRIVLVQPGSPFAFFEGIRMQPSKENAMGLFELAGGEIRYEIPALDSEIQFQDIRASFAPQAQGRIHGRVQTRLQGLLNGEVEAEGHLDTVTGNHQWDIQWKSLAVVNGLLPEGNFIEGKARLVNDAFYLDRVRVKAGAKEIWASGGIASLTQEPQAALNVKSDSPLGPTEVRLSADFKSRNLTGTFRSPSLQTGFTGKAVLKKGLMTFSRLRADSGHRGELFVDFTKAAAGIRMKRGRQEAELQGKAHGRGLELAYHVNHFEWHGMDLVSAGAFALQPIRPQSNQPFRFQTAFHTDYFIWEYVPFEDFSGSFEASALGLRDFKASWGKVFKAEGEIVPGDNGLESRLTVRAKGFDLSQVQHFASKPLPRELGGLLKGQMKIYGPVRQPFLSGRFTVRDGRLGPVTYDSGIIQFDGMAPYLKLKESRILKGRTSLSLTGALDLSLKNMFYGVRILTFDQNILWNGADMSVVQKGDKMNVELDSGISNLPALSLSASHSSQDSDSQENYLELGPRFRF